MHDFPSQRATRQYRVARGVTPALDINIRVSVSSGEWEWIAQPIESRLPFHLHRKTTLEKAAVSLAAASNRQDEIANIDRPPLRNRTAV